ncbi:hypothetical protein Syun_023274 [Stephania yunnanensis]|uniref:Uncharacterized protein n=1 Tax=Stephania yunnanensis TaxID=152371 RepID=A0AAP0HZF7_9MAGN
MVVKNVSHSRASSKNLEGTCTHRLINHQRDSNNYTSCIKTITQSFPNIEPLENSLCVAV